MSGRKETKIEGLTRLLRLNPVGTTIMGLGVAAHMLNSDSVDMLNQAGVILADGATYTGLFLLIFGKGYYKGAKRNIKENGINAEFGNRQMRHYCNRQAYYVAAVEQGYRNEVEKFIKKIPAKKKIFGFIPNI